MAKTASAWRKKRAEILDRDGHRCADCGSQSTRLNVHHRYYQDGKKPWEYENQSLVSLCPRCHGKADEMRRRLVRVVGLIERGEEERVLAFLETRAAMAMNIAPLVDAGTYERSVGIAIGMQAPLEVIERSIVRSRVDVRSLDEIIWQGWQAEGRRQTAAELGTEEAM